MNLFDYLDWRGDLTFKQDSFNSVDALALSHIIYLHFQDLIDEDFSNPVKLSELAVKLKETPDYEDRVQLGLGINPLTDDLFFKLVEHKRFKDVLITGFRCIYDEVKCEQFAAATFIADDVAYISYRGTDDTIIGWKEDFLTSYMETIPSQADALKYFYDVCDALKNQIVLIGHSKGGSMALYTSVYSDEEHQKRINKVYNLDGPGFVKEFFEKDSFKRIEDRLVNIYPEDDYVGMLQNHGNNFKIIKAASHGLGQHDPLKWQCIGNDFVNGKGFTKQSQFFNKAINDWAVSMTNDEKHRMVDALFSIYLASGCKTNYELSKNLLPASKGIIKAFNDMDKDTKKEVKRLINLLKRCMKSELPIFNMFAKIPLEESKNQTE